MTDDPTRCDATDEGGEAPCFAHLVDETVTDIGDEHDVERLVIDFYRQAAMDDLLGPIFTAEIADWNRHIATLTAFWSWQLLGERGYEGQPLRAHEPLHARLTLRHEHYERWLELWFDAVDGRFSGPTAEQAKARGRKMAAAMERLLSGVDDGGEAPAATSAIDVTISPARRSSDGGTRQV